MRTREATKNRYGGQKAASAALAAAVATDSYTQHAHVSTRLDGAKHRSTAAPRRPNHERLSLSVAMFSWTRGQQVVAIVATVAIVGAGAYIGVRRLRAMPAPDQGQFFTEAPEAEDVPQMIVHVSGQVVTPGTYYVAAGARVQDAIWAAGGVTRQADLSLLNLAAFLADGDKVTVPERPKPDSGRSSPNTEDETTIDINRATARELEQLPGIGPKLAEEIVKYRKRHGNFTRLEQLKGVPGIAERKFESIKPHIRI